MRLTWRSYHKFPLAGFRMGILSAALLTVWALQAGGASADANWPEPSGELVMEDGNLHLDCSHAQEGYVCASVINPTANRLKMQVTFAANGAQLLYDVDNSGGYEILPLQLGSGSYSFSLFENVEGTKYAAGGRVDVTTQLDREDAAFLVPNQYVNYTQDSPSVAQSDALEAGAAAQTYQQVCDFMTGEFAYDFVRAQTISPGELPEVDACFETRMGICQDLSAVMISMLRVQGIPSRLMIGYADGYYHAWTVSTVDGEERFFDPTAAINAIAASDYALERYY